MQKIKYIIIFTLILILAMVTIQLLDYQKISTNLIDDNSLSAQKNRELTQKITLLEEKNIELQDKIISLEEDLLTNSLKLQEDSFAVDYNSSIKIDTQIPYFYKKEENKSSNDTQLTPDMTIDDENQITGFGLNYKQKF